MHISNIEIKGRKLIFIDFFQFINQSEVLAVHLQNLRINLGISVPHKDEQAKTFRIAGETN